MKKFNEKFRIESVLKPLDFDYHPIWSEYYDFEELEEIESWGLSRIEVQKELKLKTIDQKHPYYTVPLECFPPERMRFYTKANLITVNGINIKGAVVNEGNLTISVFLDQNKMVTLSNHELLSDLVLEELNSISEFFKIDIRNLLNFQFVTEIPNNEELRIKGNFCLEHIKIK